MQENQSNKSPAYFFMDAEYCYTCCIRDGKLPNYSKIMEMTTSIFPSCLKLAYHVNSAKNKSKLMSLLIRLGIDSNVIFDIPASKTQIISSSISLDAATFANKHMMSGVHANFFFLTGDDYLIPIVEYLIRNNFEVWIAYYPVLFSRELEKVTKNRNNVKLIQLSDIYMTNVVARNGN